MYLTTFRGYLKDKGIKELLWLVFFFFLILPEALVYPLETGLDPSWRMSIGMAIQQHMVFGIDHIFTLGPLGFLATKFGIGANKWVIFSFELFMTGCTLFIIRFALRHFGYHILSYILITFLVVFMKGSNLIYLIPPIFIFFVFYFFHTKKLYALFPAILISIIAPFVKVNYGIVLVVLVYGTFTLILIKRALPIYQVLIIACVHFTAIFLLAWLLRVELIPYVSSCLHIISAYNDAMYMYIRFTDICFVAAFIIVILYFSGFLMQYKYYLGDLLHLFIYSIGALYLYLLFKNGFVRAGGDHPIEFMKLCALPFVLVTLFQKDSYQNKWIILTCSATLIGCIMLGRAIIQDEYNFDIHKKIVQSDYLNDLVSDISSKNVLPDNSSFSDTIPVHYVSTIGQQSVDIIPWEISEIYYYKLKYNPRPIIQSYSAYDEYLDMKNYEKYVSKSAPDYLIYSCASIDNRHPFWDESITKRAMLSHYEVASIDSMYLLMRKRAKPITLKTLQKKKVTLEIGKEYTLENPENIQYLYANIQYSLLGKLKRILFQPPPLKVFLTYDNNRTIEHKAIVPILKTGVLLNSQVNTTAQAGAFFSGKGNTIPKLRSIRFDARHGFETTIEAVIEECILTE